MEVPLALNLQRRAEAELEAQSQAQAQLIASFIGDPRTLTAALQARVTAFQDQVGGRVIVVNKEPGALVADSAGPELVGQVYAKPSRPELLEALEGASNTRIGRSETLDEEIMATAVPVFVNGVVVGAVRITQPTTELRASIRRTLAGVAAIGIGGLLAGLLIAFVLAGSLSRPLQRLSRAAQRLGRGDLSVRADTTHGAREIREMAAAFDDMASRLERLVRGQREFVGNASHQLRTPLTGLKLRLESAAAKSPPEVRRDIEAAEREADRLAAIVERLLSLARRAESGGGPDVDLAYAVEQAVARWHERARAAGATVESTTAAGEARADAEDVGQILDNLLENAIRYAPGEIRIEVGENRDRLLLAVEDRGPGIPADEIDRVTERFYRGHGAPAGGSGLGLAVVRELAERWGGTVSVKAAEPAGTRVEVVFPKIHASV